MASISPSIHTNLETPSPAPSSGTSPFKFQTGGRGRQSLPISISSSKREGISLTAYKHKQHYIQNLKVSAISEPSSATSSSYVEPDYLVKKVTGKELNDLLNSDRATPLVVDFYATWCGPCALLAQQLELLAVEYGDSVTIVKIDTDEEYELASQLQIRGLPTVIFISPDHKKNAVRIEGLLPNETMKSIIDTEL
ncbi:hypothetical protein SUGI_0575000 [Cryptomeria japonica]|nr:hypothetical protein SUGI_0575000 [Cryptomeria japonica]